MTTDWRKRLEARIHELELSPAELSRRADVGPTMVHDILKRGSTPSVYNLRKIVKALGWSFDNLFEGTTADGIELTIDYALVGGEMLKQAEAVNRGPLPLSFLDQDLASLRVETNEYKSVGYRKGDIVAGVRSYGKSIRSLTGQECLIKTASGDLFFKVLAASNVAGRYTLRSLDHTGDDISDVKIEWAAPVNVIVRN